MPHRSRKHRDGSDEAGRLTRGHVRRLTEYHDFVRELSLTGNGNSVSSARIAGFVGVDPSQVRKDLIAIGISGQPRVGFRVDHIVAGIRRALGIDRPHRGVLLGAGKLGGALASYPGFAESGLVLVAAFDADPSRVGARVGRLEVRPLHEMPQVVSREKVRLAVLAVPVPAAQEAADLAVAAGVRAIWTFAPARLTVPGGVAVRYENTAFGLTELLHHLALVEG